MEGATVLTLLRSRSQHNNYAQSVVGTYFVATGGQRQHVSILSTLGLSVGYGGIIDQRKPVSVHRVQNKKKTLVQTTGILSKLSEACRNSTRKVAASGLYVIVCDNINMMVRVAEQVLGQKGMSLLVCSVYHGVN